ncbi:MAG: AtpZ/AtpI family protein [Pseudomonadota bacterium]
MSDDDLSTRRRALKAQLDAKEVASEKEAARGPSAMAGYAVAFRLSTEFVSAILVGLAIGFGLDYALGTTPWLMILFLMLGFAAGVLNVLRSAGLIQPPQAGKRPPEHGKEPGTTP